MLTRQINLFWWLGVIAMPALPSTQATAKSSNAGIWKSAVPPVEMKGAFGNHDPIGLVNGQFIKADCSINWTDPDSHRLFCFSTPTSMAVFLYWPKRNAQQAEKTWNTARQPDGSKK